MLLISLVLLFTRVNTYDLVIGIQDSVPNSDARTILANLETTLSAASRYMYSALRGRAFLQTVTIVLPASWPDYCAPITVTSGSGEFPDVTVLPEDKRGKMWTQQSAGCGQPGDQIYLGYESLLKRDDLLARLFVKNFAKYRFGVFDEEGYENDPIYPNCYYDNDGKHERVTGCSDLPIKNNGICSTKGEKSYNKTEMVDEKARSSIMFAAEVPSVSMFCDEGTHDRYAPTKHNFMCNLRSTFDIISDHADFSSNTISPNHHNTNQIINTTPRIFYKKQNITRYVLVIENSNDMKIRDSWNHLKVAIMKWSLFDLPENTEIDIILAQENGASKHPEIVSLRTISRWEIVYNVPFDSGVSGQQACLHCALKDAIISLANRSKYNNAARNVIVVIAPGMNMNFHFENLVKKAKKAKIRIATINYPKVIRSQMLDYLATETDGVAFTVTEQKYNVETGMISSYFQLTSVFYNIIETYYSGNPSDLPMEIHRRKLIYDGRTSVTGSFVLDDNMGEPVLFMLYVPNIDRRLIRGLSLLSPSHREYSEYSLYMIDSKIVSLSVNLSEPGTWTYTIDRYTGNPQPHFVQVMATPRSRTVPVVRARFWIHKNQPAGGGPLILLAEVKRGNWPVLGAKVEATFTRSEINGSKAYTDRFELLDMGGVDPDITKDDGIYSQYYFNAAADGPGTYTFEVVVTDNGNTAYTWQGSFKGPEDKPCCGSSIPTSSVQPIPPFQRVLPPITIPIPSEDAVVKADQVTAGRIDDSKVQIKPEDTKDPLTWTSSDVGGTGASRYQVKYATTYTDIVDNYEVLAKTDPLASPTSNSVQVLVPSPPSPPTVLPTFIPSDQTPRPNNGNSVVIDQVSPTSSRSGNFGLEVILPVVIGVIILAIVPSLYCYFRVFKRRSRNNKNDDDDKGKKRIMMHSNDLQTDKPNSPVIIVPSSPLHSSQNSQGYIDYSDLPDHHTVEIGSFDYEDEPKNHLSLVRQQQEQQPKGILKQRHLQNRQNTTPHTYAVVSVMSNNSLMNGGRTLNPYHSQSAWQLLDEQPERRRHGPLENTIPKVQSIPRHQSEIHYMSMNGQNVDGHQIANQIPIEYKTYAVQQPQQMIATTQQTIAERIEPPLGTYDASL